VQVSCFAGISGKKGFLRTRFLLALFSQKKFLAHICSACTFGTMATNDRGSEDGSPVSDAPKPERINFSPTAEENAVLEALIRDAERLGFPMTRMQAMRWLVKTGMKSYAQKKPLLVKTLKIPATPLRDLPSDRGSALLLLGVFVNEVNWLRKLLVMAVQALPDTPGNQTNNPEEEASFALTGLLATTLVGKVYEGWECMERPKFKATLDALSMPEELKGLKRRLSEQLSGKLFLRIRQQAFHYSEKVFDFSKFRDYFGDQDTHIHVTAAGYRGDILSHISALGRAYALCNLAHLVDGDSDAASEAKLDVLVAYKRVLDQVVQVTGLYSEFVADTLTTLMSHEFSGKITFKPFIVPDAPEVQAERVHFFLHPPNNLEPIHSELLPDVSNRG
jgi:hypothetical protein